MTWVVRLLSHDDCEDIVKVSAEVEAVLQKWKTPCTENTTHREISVQLLDAVSTTEGLEDNAATLIQVEGSCRYHR